MMRWCLLLLLASIVWIVAPAQAEYADVVINRRSDSEGVRPVIFPHWFHRIRFQCRVCHKELDFKMRAGLSDRTNLRDFDIFDEHRGPTIFAAKRRKSRNLPNRRKIEVT